MEGKWTKGPWVYIAPVPHEEIEGAFAHPGGIEGADGDPVCIFGDWSGSGTMFENQANATLIAAAPDLLEALKTTLSLLEIWRGWTPSYSTAHTDFESLPEVIEARSAIARATGGESSTRPGPQPVAQARTVPRSLAQGEGDAAPPAPDCRVCGGTGEDAHGQRCVCTYNKDRAR